MVTILKSLMATSEEYIGKLHTVALERKDPAKNYTADEITIDGFMDDGRPYRLHLKVSDKA